MNVDVVVPWRDSGCEYRQRALGWVLVRWASRHPTWRVWLAGCGPGPWRKADAVNPAVRRSTADVIVVADADVWVDEVEVAVAAVSEGAGWAVPHRQVLRLTAQSTQTVYLGVTPEDAATGNLGEVATFAGGSTLRALDEPAYNGVAGGGIVVLRPDVAVDVPLDPRFEGWGGEDHAWGYALETLVGPCWRGTAPLWHLWHPPEPRTNRVVGNPENEALRRRYWLARGHQKSMRDIVEEVHQWQLT